jgi:hypothetical protein
MLYVLCNIFGYFKFTKIAAGACQLKRKGRAETLPENVKKNELASTS